MLMRGTRVETSHSVSHFSRDRRDISENRPSALLTGEFFPCGLVAGRGLGVVFGKSPQHPCELAIPGNEGLGFFIVQIVHCSLRNRDGTATVQPFRYKRIVTAQPPTKEQ